MMKGKPTIEIFEVIITDEEYDEYQALKIENAELRAELEHIRPSWDDAPEWAITWYVECGWMGNRACVEEVHSCAIENRPSLKERRC
jgi:hypothetical protein